MRARTHPTLTLGHPIWCALTPEPLWMCVSDPLSILGLCVLVRVLGRLVGIIRGYQPTMWAYWRIALVFTNRPTDRPTDD